MSDLFTVFRELKVNPSFVFINLELEVEVVFCAYVFWIMTWEYLKISLFSEYLCIIWIGLNYLFETGNFFSVFIDASAIDV
jgi:hypothetical protein